MVASPYAILLVDDHKDTVDLLTRFLARRGMSARSCLDPLLALDAMRKDRPEVVVLDQEMPGMTGLEVMNVMHEEEGLNDIPVIFYSAHFDQNMAGKAIRSGAVDWLVKGVHGMEHLMRAIDAAMKRNSARRGAD